MMAFTYYDILPHWDCTVNIPYAHINHWGNYISEVYTYNGHKYNIGEEDASGNIAYGGYGYITQNNWENTKSHMAEYASYHGCVSGVDWSPTWTEYVNEINNGYPVVVLNSLTGPGHFILGTGYVQGQHTIITNDPYGDKNQGYMNYNGLNAKYDWPGYNNGFQNLNTVHCFVYFQMDRYVGSLRDVSYEKHMEAGGCYDVSVTIRNTGNKIWRAAGSGAVYLKTWGPANRNSEFYTSGNWVGPGTVGKVSSDIKPGQTARFDFKMTAPAETDMFYTEQFRLYRDGTGWFGPDNIAMDIRVRDTTPPPEPVLLESPAGWIGGYPLIFNWSAGNDVCGIETCRIRIHDQPDLEGVPLVDIHINQSEADPTYYALREPLIDGQYFYAISFIDGSSLEEPGFPDNFTLAMKPPERPNITEAPDYLITTNQASFSWTPGECSGPVCQFNLTLVFESGQNKTIIIGNNEPLRMNYTIYPLPKGEIVYYLSQSDSMGRWSPVAMGSFTVDTEPPETPGTPLVVNQRYHPSNGSVILRWNGSSDRTTNIDHYIVEYGILDDGTTQQYHAMNLLKSDTASIRIIGLEQPNRYVFRVKAVDSVGWESTWSTFSQPCVPDTAPPLISATAGVDMSAGSVNITCRISDPGSGITSCSARWWTNTTPSRPFDLVPVMQYIFRGSIKLPERFNGTLWFTIEAGDNASPPNIALLNSSVEIHVPAFPVQNGTNDGPNNSAHNSTTYPHDNNNDNNDNNNDNNKGVIDLEPYDQGNGSGREQDTGSKHSVSEVSGLMVGIIIAIVAVVIAICIVGVWVLRQLRGSSR